MPGSHIHILEAMDVAGGACDGIFDPTRGYVMRGGREMEIILNVCGICSAAFHHWKSKGHPCWTSITG